MGTAERRTLCSDRLEDLASQLERAVVVAVVTVRAVQVTIDEVVDMITVRNGFVSAVRAMHMRRIVARALVAGCAVGGVGSIDMDLMLVDMVSMQVMQMTIMQVVHVVSVLHGDVAAVRAMSMVVVRVFFTAHSILHFTGVIDHALDQLGDVFVSERVILVFPVSTTSEQTLCSKNSESS